MNMKTSVAAALPEHGMALASDMLPEHSADIERGWGVSPEEAIMTAMEKSAGDCWTIFADGRVAGIFGAVGGNVWIITGRAFEDDRIAFRFVRQSGKYIDALLEKYGRLYGYLSADNERMVRWLEWSGFDIEDMGNGYVRCEKCALL